MLFLFRKNTILVAPTMKWILTIALSFGFLLFNGSIAASNVHAQIEASSNHDDAQDLLGSMLVLLDSADMPCSLSTEVTTNFLRRGLSSIKYSVTPSQYAITGLLSGVGYFFNCQNQWQQTSLPLYLAIKVLLI